MTLSVTHSYATWSTQFSVGCQCTYDWLTALLDSDWRKIKDLRYSENKQALPTDYEALYPKETGPRLWFKITFCGFSVSTDNEHIRVLFLSCWSEVIVVSYTNVRHLSFRNLQVRQDDEDFGVTGNFSELNFYNGQVSGWKRKCCGYHKWSFSWL